MDAQNLSKDLFYFEPRCKYSPQILDLNPSLLICENENPEISVQPYRKLRASTPRLRPSGLKVAVRTDTKSRYKGRWICGSDPMCDVVLDADNTRSVSRVHFEIYYDRKSGELVIQNQGYLTTLQIDGRNINIEKGQRRVLVYSDYSLVVGLLLFRLEIPKDRGEHEQAFEKNLNTLFQGVENELPDVAGLAIKRRGIATPAVDGPRITETSVPVDRYHPRFSVGSGNTGRVFNGIDTYTGQVVALKQFHDKRKAENIETEVKILKDLKHVSWNILYSLF